MRRYRFRPRLDTLELRLPLSGAGPITAIDPTDPIYTPEPPAGCPTIIAPVVSPDPTAPQMA